jgi:hypothetical protein
MQLAIKLQLNVSSGIPGQRTYRDDLAMRRARRPDQTQTSACFPLDATYTKTDTRGLHVGGVWEIEAGYHCTEGSVRFYMEFNLQTIFSIACVCV